MRTENKFGSLYLDHDRDYDILTGAWPDISPLDGLYHLIRNWVVECNQDFFIIF